MQFGDLFEQDGWKTIPVNEFFDSLVDDKHVSAESLHGIFLQKFWAGNIVDWDKQIDNSLSENDLLEEIKRNSGKTKRYRIGATAIAEKDGNKFFCVALTKTNIGSLQAAATSIDLLQALSCLLVKAREICAGNALNIPLLGSGLSRTGIKLNILVDLILMVIFEESKKNKITDKIRIVLPKNKIKEIDLNTLQKDWR
ncbi:MAG: macro domain-containing protein [bacterium]